MKLSFESVLSGETLFEGSVIMKFAAEEGGFRLVVKPLCAAIQLGFFSSKVLVTTNRKLLANTAVELLPDQRAVRVLPPLLKFLSGEVQVRHFYVVPEAGFFQQNNSTHVTIRLKPKGRAGLLQSFQEQRLVLKVVNLLQDQPQ